MKKKNSLIIIVISLFFIGYALMVGMNSWNSKVQSSTLEAAMLLESEGLKVRTIDMSKFEKADKESATNVQDLLFYKETKSNEVELELRGAKTQPGTTSDQDLMKGSTNSSTTTTEQVKEQIKGRTLQEIKQLYSNQLTQLESETSASLDAILDAAIQDFRSKRNNNEKINIREFQATHITFIHQLEIRTDQRFNEIINQLEVDLIDNGFSKSEVAPFIAKYQTEKQNREQKAIEKFRAMN